MLALGIQKMTSASVGHIICSAYWSVRPAGTLAGTGLAWSSVSKFDSVILALSVLQKTLIVVSYAIGHTDWFVCPTTASGRTRFTAANVIHFNCTVFALGIEQLA